VRSVVRDHSFSTANFCKFRSLRTVANFPNSTSCYLLSELSTFWIIYIIETSVTLCIKCSLIIDLAIPRHWGHFLCCSGVLLIAEVVSPFKKIGSFVRKLRILGLEWENTGNHCPGVLNSTELCVNVEIQRKSANLQLGSNSGGLRKTVVASYH